MDLSTVGLNNQSYTEREQDIIRRSRQACTKKIKVLQDEIKVLQDEIRQVKVEIRRLDTALAAHKKLPPEVWRRIFELCCCEKPALISARYLLLRDDIYTISHVCSMWRQIALSTPEFWSKISIELEDEKNNEHKLQMLTSGFREQETVPDP